MNITFFEVEAWEKPFLERSLKNHKLTFFKESLNQNNVKKIKDTEILCTFVYSQITPEILEQLPKLKFIATMSTGFEHINLKECKKRKIAISNIPSYGENTVAEHTFALILALSRKIFQSIERTHLKHSFETDASLTGFDIRKKTIGIIGYGHIGKHVVNIAKGFDMNILVSDPKPDKKAAKKIGFKFTNLPNLLKKSDIITLHVPYLPSTHHLINKNSIDKMKKGVIIINTSRGGIVDTTALVQALKSKKIAGAALDVLEEEDCIKEEKELLSSGLKTKCDLSTILENHILMKMDNVLITPHNAFNSKEALQRILGETIENIQAFIRKRPQNRV